MPSVATIAADLDRFAPRALAAEWDNVGLLLGDPQSEVQRLMTCLTVTRSTAAEAIEAGAQMIVSHHPILFRGAKKLSLNSPDGDIVWPLARAGIAVYSPHTAFDNCAGGINDQIAERLGLIDVRPLRPKRQASFKIVVFTPDADLAKVSDALFQAGAGIIGQYSQCSFRLAGTGTFFGSDSTNPTVGVKGQREVVSEWRLEVVCSAEKLDGALRAMRTAHSYEEPAYDVYPLQPSLVGGGEGRIGRRSQPVKLVQLVEEVEKEFAVAHVPFVGDQAQSVSKIAIACGAAGEFLSDAVRAGADAFFTGEMRYHDLLTAEAKGLAVILPGHHATERLGVERLSERLQTTWPGLTIWPSRRESDPLSFR